MHVTRLPSPPPPLPPPPLPPSQCVYLYMLLLPITFDIIDGCPSISTFVSNFPSYVFASHFLQQYSSHIMLYLNSYDYSVATSRMGERTLIHALSMQTYTKTHIFNQHTYVLSRIILEYKCNKSHVSITQTKLFI